MEPTEAAAAAADDHHVDHRTWNEVVGAQSLAMGRWWWMGMSKLIAATRSGQVSVYNLSISGPETSPLEAPQETHSRPSRADTLP